MPRSSPLAGPPVVPVAAACTEVGSISDTDAGLTAEVSVAHLRDPDWSIEQEEQRAAESLLHRLD